MYAAFSIHLENWWLIGLHFVHRFTSAPIVSDVVVEMSGVRFDILGENVWVAI